MNELTGSKFIPAVNGIVGSVLDSVVFAVIAFALVVMILWGLCKTRLQTIVIPQFDELQAIGEKWRAGEELSKAESIFALACAINGGLRIVGVLFVVGLLATFL